MAYDFSFNNSSIKDWFEEVPGSSCPTSEFKYLHDHPLVKPNFVNDLERLIYEAGVAAHKKNVKGKPIDKLVSLASDLTKSLSSFIQDKSSDNAETCLKVMRQLYQLCKFITSLK